MEEIKEIEGSIIENEDCFIISFKPEKEITAQKKVEFTEEN